jgi:hypothetical protein
MTPACTCPECGQPHYVGFGPDTVAPLRAENERLKADNEYLNKALIAALNLRATLEPKP